MKTNHPNKPETRVKPEATPPQEPLDPSSSPEEIGRVLEHISSPYRWELLEDIPDLQKRKSSKKDVL